MPHYLVRYDISSAFFDLPKEKQTQLQDAEIGHANEVRKEGKWKLFLGGTKARINWGLYKGDSTQEIEEMIKGFPMHTWYTTTVHEVNVIDPLKLSADDTLIHLKQFFTGR